MVLLSVLPPRPIAGCCSSALKKVRIGGSLGHVTPNNQVMALTQHMTDRHRHTMTVTTAPSPFRTLLLSSLACMGAALSAPGADAAAPDAAKAPWGLWVGTLKTQAGTCPDQMSSTLQITRKHVNFTPGDGSMVLTGTRHADGSVHAELILSDRNHKPLPLVFNAKPVADTFEGDYGTTTCRAHVVLRQSS